MNIGIFTDFYKPTINGIVSSVETFRLELERLGHQVYIFCPEEYGAKKEQNVIRLRSYEVPIENFTVTLPFYPTFYKSIEHLNLDIVHSHVPFPVGFLGHYVAKRARIPEVHTYHTHLAQYAHYAPATILEPIVKYGLIRLSRVFCNRTDAVIAPSTSLKRILRSYGVRKPIYVCPTGIETKDFCRLEENEKAELCRQFDIPANKKILLFAGRIAKEKNISFLLRCFAEIAQNRDDIILVLAGSGPEHDSTMNQIKSLRLDKKTRMTGFLDKKTLAKLYGIADVFTFPSVTETQGLVLCEAMAAGCPVIAMNSLGPRDIVKDGVNGFLIDEIRSEFVDRLDLLLGDESLRLQMGANAKRTIERFSVKNTTEKLLEIYQTEIDKKITENQKSG